MTFDEHMRSQARAYLLDVLERADCNVIAAAKLAGRTRQNFYRLMQRYGVVTRLQAGLASEGNEMWRGLGREQRGN